MPRPPTHSAHERVRKNMDMDAAKLAEAQRILGTRTDTETVDQALDYVVFVGEEFATLDRLAALGGLATPFDDVVSRPRRVAEP
ncbi:MAG TPA: hypothetical protein VHB25_14110 [Gemmatimonadaceae bacterium]|nr:hypothetical protein [Gemmatimonadaceae bacterium]